MCYYLSFPKCKARILYTALHLYVWPVLRETIFPHYLFNNTNFWGKKFIEHKMCFDILYHFEIFLIPTQIQRDIMINTYRYSCKVALVLVSL